MQFKKQIEHRHDTVLGKDGLLYCANCGGKRQTAITIPGPFYGIRDCLCPCEVEARKAREAESEKREKEMRIKSLIADGVEDKALLENTFGRSTLETRAIKVAQWYVDTWEEHYRDGMGILFYGNVGTGKSFAAACIANALLLQEKSVLLTSVQRVVAGIPSAYSGEVNRYFDRFASYSLLVLDDLGVTRDTEFMTEQIYKLVDERYKSGKPMIVTTNVTPEQMKAAKSIEWRRIYDRVLEMCLPVKVDGQSIRKAATKTKIDKMRDGLTAYFKDGGK